MTDKARKTKMDSGIGPEVETGFPIFPETLKASFVAAEPAARAADGASGNFERVKAQLKARLGNDVYSSWFGRMKVAEASRGVVRL
jgi:chromosomal replication initiator protein